MNFDNFFHPRTMAVIGVSTSNDLHPANVVYGKNLLRYPVKVFPVNPKGGTLLSQKVYRKITDIEEELDLAIIAVRADLVPATVRECAAAGVKGAIVISGGFAEAGRNDLQEEMLAEAEKGNLPVIGPNCLGIFTPAHVDTFFLPSERTVQPGSGNVGIVSQSGGILVDLLVKFADEGIGLSSAVSIGNKAMIRELSLLDHFIHDPLTGVIVFYIEGFRENEGREFVIAAKNSPKPVVVLKSGKTAGGVRAVSSHTASLAGDYHVFKSVLEQHGVYVAANELELTSYCEALSCYEKPAGGRIGIVSGSGGHGALAVDSCAAYGLSAEEFPIPLQEDLRRVLSDSIKGIASVANPIDLTGSALEHDFEATVETLSKSDQIDCILLLLLPYLPGISSDLGARISMIYRREGKPLIAYVPHVEKFRMLIEGFELNRVPVASSIESAVMMAKALTGKRNG
ncbi:MAG: CoA-binding protein [Proteobacteria bacterium]|nr:CoA-binding protein [Pseudomonadota bacterium]MBU1736946.1 CoA-binding protein [Pseudomonadota bacterium]